MLPRFHLMSATLLALAATMSEEDSPVVPSPEPDEGGREGPESHWSSVLGRAILDDMRADEDAVAGAAVEAKVVAAFPHMRPWEAQEGSHYDLDAGQGHNYDGRYEPSHLRVWVNGLATEQQFTFVSPRMTSQNRSDQRPEQREHKKARAKRKAKKGWA